MGSEVVIPSNLNGFGPNRGQSFVAVGAPCPNTVLCAALARLLVGDGYRQPQGDGEGRHRIIFHSYTSFPLSLFMGSSQHCGRTSSQQDVL